MKISGKLLLDFLYKVNVKGRINKCVIDFGKDGVTINAKDQYLFGGVVGFLKKDSFKNYEAIGEVGMEELDFFIKKLSIYSGILEEKDELKEVLKKNIEFTIENNNNELFISTSLGHFEFPSKFSSFIENDFETINIEKLNNFEFPVTVESDIFSDEILGLSSVYYLINEDITIKIKDNQIEIEDSDLDRPIRTLKEKINEEVNVTYSFLFYQVNDVIGGRGIFSLGTNMPAKIVYEDENMSIIYVIAPKMSKK